MRNWPPTDPEITYFATRRLQSPRTRGIMVNAPALRPASLISLGLAYFVVSAATMRLTRFDGGVAFLWIATAILTARLTTMPMRHWAAPLAICSVASILATSLWGFGPSMALPFAAINMLEGALGAAILHRFAPWRPVLDSHRWLLTFALATGVIAPLTSAALAASILASAAEQPFLRSGLNWYSGHALGTLTFMPIFMLVMRGDAVRLVKQMDQRKLVEFAALVALVGTVTYASFAQDRLPLLFLPILPMVLATFRGGALSTAASIVIVAVIGGALTLQGHGPLALVDAPIGAKMQFLQLYIACAMLTILPANAELQQRACLFRRLRESEARYRLLTENSTDIVINLDVGGRLQFASTSIAQISGFEPDKLIGRRVSRLLHPDDAARAETSFRRIIAEPTKTHVNEYRGVIGGEDVRWFETHSRAVTDDIGNVTGVVSAIRDVSNRKAHEERLARAALTDALTGLANRRGLDEELGARLSTGSGGCVALFDLDHFKRINDTHGHAAGDEVLRRFATLARASVREQDLVARLGGEEFAVVLPEATISQAALVCERLRHAIASTSVQVGESLISVTVSGGVAPYLRNQSSEDILRVADRALYRAKHAGRDQLALAA
ncbi:diguanylate cyclase [Sphingomonas sp. IC-11]|uniref:sensor domain-containing diguanylate cyclase n=1 Tax=Sphingomonas sp. IC-11 TaxID=2898528 RepID=UPI001E5FE5BB|nr:sensor domain-containing diguanylate cyclase [Sphingomonas sp. IC-11]MCD2315759.1 diguanylate cyclase [Sphingomonas sp. IC-11]